MITEQDTYLKILAYCLTDNMSITPPKVDEINWSKFYSFCESQAILGIGLQCIDKLKSQLGGDLKVPQVLLLQWIGIAEQIKNQNKLLNKRTKDISEYFTSQGKQCCVLKGQGNALMYPEPKLRTSGDIDVWLEGTKKEIADFVHQHFPKMNVQYHHMEYPIYDDVEIEIHYYPSYCYNKWYNHRLQRYFHKESHKQFLNKTDCGFNVPTVPFNIVFQLSHIMRHFFTQGIGLRHAIDYYYLLKQDITQEEIKEVVSVIKSCGMYKFFCALLWIENSILGLDKAALFVPVNERAGKLVLHEMLKGGNFGHRYNHVGSTALSTFAMQMKYNFRYTFIFPLEPLSRPFTLVLDYIKKHCFVI